MSLGADATLPLATCFQSCWCLFENKALQAIELPVCGHIESANGHLIVAKLASNLGLFLAKTNMNSTAWTNIELYYASLAFGLSMSHNGRAHLKPSGNIGASVDIRVCRRTEQDLIVGSCFSWMKVGPARRENYKLIQAWLEPDTWRALILARLLLDHH